MSAQLKIFYHLLMVQMEVRYVFHPEHFSKYHFSVLFVSIWLSYQIFHFILGGGRLWINDGNLVLLLKKSIQLSLHVVDLYDTAV